MTGKKSTGYINDLLSGKLKKLSVILLSLSFCYCDHPTPPDDCNDYDYSNCNTVKPGYGNIIVKITINRNITTVPLSIYQGNIDDGFLIFHDTLEMELVKYRLPVNQTYTVIAHYNLDGRKIKAINSGRIVRKGYLICDSVCYVVREPVIDIKLRKDLLKK